MTLIFQILDKTIGLRVSTREEIAGLDMEEHGLASSYADFMPAAEDFHGAVTAQEAAELVLPLLTLLPLCRQQADRK